MTSSPPIEIIVAHLPIVKKVAAKKYAAKNDTDDLIQEGVFGIKKALDAFDPEMGVRFGVLAKRPSNARLWII